MTLSKKYNMIMEEINVTPDMRLRILKNIANQPNTTQTYKTDLSGKIIQLNRGETDSKHFRLNRSTVSIIAAAACTVLCIYGIYSHNISNVPKPSTPSHNVAVLPDDKSTESDNKNSSGEYDTPSDTNGAVPGENTDNTITAEGSDDISGDYNTYRQKKQITVNGASVTLKGNNGKINVATWSSNGYSYSINVGKGFDESYITDLISMIE